MQYKSNGIAQFTICVLQIIKNMESFYILPKRITVILPPKSSESGNTDNSNRSWPHVAHAHVRFVCFDIYLKLFGLFFKTYKNGK